MMASLALAQGGLAAWIADRAEHQVIRGRIAGDLQSGLWELSATKQRLRAWSLRALIGADHAPGDGEMLRLRMAGLVDRLQVLSARADRMDARLGRTSSEGAQRDDALDLLSENVVALQAPIAEINRREPTADARTAWAAIEAVFDRGAGLDLREILDRQIEAEARMLLRTRQTADAYLRTVKLLSGSAAATLSLTALGLALYFSRALRRPLLAMSDSAAAFEHGQLEHRMPEQGFREFARLGGSINRMAAELSERRAREAELRADLEVEVAARTQDLQAALGELRQAEARRRQLLGDLGHELRTPMTAIQGEAEVALRGARSPADHREALQRITQASRQLSVRLQDLLMMAQGDAEPLSLSLAETDPQAALEEALATLSPVAAMRSVTITARTEGGPFTVTADGQRLLQAITLLLDNAIRYSQAGGAVTVTAGPDAGDPGRWRLDIADTGIGISEADLARVFERGYRTAAARAHRADGTGLGLPIARTLAERQGGRLELESAPGSGTRAILTLPGRAEAAGQARAIAASPTVLGEV